MTGKLAGIPYCPAAALAAAAASGGGERARRAPAARPRASSAPPRSPPAPARRPCTYDGKVFLSGPYHGAPLSLAVVTPATAGPFDLGTVVVRVALFVDPETAQIRAVSDPIPDVFGGAQLSVRSVDVDARPQGLHAQPDQLRTAGQRRRILNGGGADPANPAAFSAFPVSDPVPDQRLRRARRSGRSCSRASSAAGRRPSAPSTRNSAPSSSPATATPTSAAPRSPCRTPQFLDQSHIRTVCTRVQLAAHDCPAGGHLRLRASAGRRCSTTNSPGPVYLVSSNHALPDLLADLRGQVERAACTASSAPPRRGSRPSSTPCPTCRSASSC